MRLNKLGRSLAVVLSTALVATSGGCSLFTGSGSADRPTPEKQTLRVGIMPMVDVAPLYMAREEGKFAAAGLNVELIDLRTEDGVLTGLKNQTVDVGFATHVTWFKAAAAEEQIQLQGEAYQAGGNTMALVTLKDSSYTALNKNQGGQSPPIAVDQKTGLAGLATSATLNSAGVGKPNLREVSFDKMQDELATKKVEAAWMIEPWITKAQKQIGAKVLADTARGGMLDFPISGYASMKKFAEENPKTLRIFREVLNGAQLQGGNHLKVQEVLTKYAEVDQQTAALVAVGTYPVSINPVRLQRVADMMERLELLKTRLDVQQLLPPSDSVS
ncbi:NitT/TauT family transport system substrate-binding protein [Crossiella equi]|uniref:NitT/TauT family transport system substrate-binding protein n=1 Tax=Crossiella equi TaxID=130796 RepID=A0ABS5AFE9_9PSEU|nr:ABC transporter substrate-binding protein [Crossiella equi]MBP2475047.1 NitT/TauT family transport system substrate-binding protein [Crossiella equi]